MAPSHVRAAADDGSRQVDTARRKQPLAAHEHRRAIHVAFAALPGHSLERGDRGRTQAARLGVLRDHAADRMLAVAVHGRRQSQHLFDRHTVDGDHVDHHQASRA